MKLPRPTLTTDTRNATCQRKILACNSQNLIYFNFATCIRPLLHALAEKYFPKLNSPSFVVVVFVVSKMSPRRVLQLLRNGVALPMAQNRACGGAARRILHAQDGTANNTAVRTTHTIMFFSRALLRGFWLIFHGKTLSAAHNSSMFPATVGRTV